MPILPWDDHPIALPGDALEQEVLGLLRAAGKTLPHFDISHREAHRAPDGTYVIDITVRFSGLAGAAFKVLVECKDHARHVERKDVQVLNDKMRSLGAQKAILVATNGFQKGALEYAFQHGIALARIVDRRLLYEARAAPTAPPPRQFPGVPEPVMIVITGGDTGGWRTTNVDASRTEGLRDVLNDAARSRKEPL